MINNKEKIVVCVMGQNCDKFMSMCYKSIKNADAIVFCDGGSSDGTIDYLKLQKFKWSPENHSHKIMIYQNYDQIDKKMNGKQRNFYLKYLKKHYNGWWALCIDADEVVEDLDKFKKFINFLPTQNHDILFSPKMRHLIGDLGHEDSTQPVHFVPHRLFKIRDDLEYQEVEHSVLTIKNKTECRSQNLMISTIWHMAYCSNVWDIKKRYDNHLLKSNMHTPEYLKNWRNAHLFGVYPRKQFDIIELPEIILNEFDIEKDELYFKNRKQMEVKHYQDAIDWKEFFNLESVLLYGCGFGQRVKILNDLGVYTQGIEKSEYAVKNKLHNNIKIGDITKNYTEINDLVVAYDILEHLKYEELDKAIKNIIRSTKKYILISVPYKGTPNCENDKTHIIKEDRDWWLNKFLEKGLKEVKVPEHFLFKEQLLIFK